MLLLGSVTPTMALHQPVITEVVMLRLLGKTSDKIKLSQSEINKLRRLAAKNGIAINAIETDAQYGEALYCALPKAISDDMAAFFDHYLEEKPYQRDPALFDPHMKPENSQA